MHRLSLFCLFLAACPASSPEAPSAPDATDPAAQVPASVDTLAGTVTETMDAAGYTYLHLQTADGAAWAAVQQAAVMTETPRA